MAQETRSPEPLKQRSREGLLAFWAAEMGLSVPELLIPVSGVRISIRPALSGVLVFRRGDDVRISTADANIERLGRSLPRELKTDFCSPAMWRSVFPELSGSVTGPTRYAYLDAVPQAWAQQSASRKQAIVRGLAASDLKTYADFAMTLSRAEREMSGLDTFGRQLWGVFSDGVLAAVAGYDAWPHRVAHLGVATHPDFRGRKFAQLAVQAASRGAVARKRIAQFACLSSSTEAVAVASALGFSRFAETLITRP